MKIDDKVNIQTTGLKCLPICECGYVFEKLESYTRLIQITENYHREERFFNPEVCPNCKKSILSIDVPKVGYGGSINIR